MSNATQLTSTVMNISNSTGFVEITQKVNDYMSGGIGVMIWLMLTIVVFFSLKNAGYYNGDAGMATLFFGFVIGLLLRGMNLIPDLFFYPILIMLGIVGVISVMNK